MTVRAATTMQIIPIHVSEIKTIKETATHFILCKGHMVQMFSRYVSNNFLFEEDL